MDGFSSDTSDTLGMVGINVQDLMATSSERVCELDFILKFQGLRNFFHESFAKFGLISPEIEIKIWAISFETLVFP